MTDDLLPLTLGDVVTLQRGTTYKSVLLGQPGPVLLGLASIQRNGGFRNDNLKTYGGDCPEKLTLRSGDIYVSLKDVTQSADLLGAVARVPQYITTGRVTQDTVKLSFIREEIPPSFIYWLLRTPVYREYCRAHAIGTTNLSISREDFLAFPFIQLEAAELKIIEMLDALDDLIELNRETNEILEEMARALFKSWFVDFDPVRAKLEGRQPEGMDAATAALFPDHFQDSELGQIPMGWTVGAIGSVCNSPRATVKPDEVNPETAYIGLEHMPRRSVALSEWEPASKVVSAKSVFEKGDILFGKLRPYFHKVGIAPLSGVCSTDILVLRPKFLDWYGFVLGYASSDELVQYADRSSAGTKMPRTSWRDISAYRVALPPRPLVKSFTQMVEPIIQSIVANVHESRDLAALRDTLLPKLLSGEITVPAAEELIAAATK